MPVKIAIYVAPDEGLPFLVVSFESGGLKVSTAASQFEARTVASKRAIRWSERKSDGSMVTRS